MYTEELSRVLIFARFYVIELFSRNERILLLQKASRTVIAGNFTFMFYLKKKHCFLIQNLKFLCLKVLLKSSKLTILFKNLCIRQTR